MVPRLAFHLTIHASYLFTKCLLRVEEQTDKNVYRCGCDGSSGSLPTCIEIAFLVVVWHGPAQTNPPVRAHGARLHLLPAQAALRQRPRAFLLGRPHLEQAEKTDSVMGPPRKQGERMLCNPHSQPEILLRGPLVPQPTVPGECREGCTTSSQPRKHRSSHPSSY